MRKILATMLFSTILTVGCGSKDKKKDTAPTGSDPVATGEPGNDGLDIVIADHIGTVSTNNNFMAHLKWTTEIKAENLVSAQLTFAKLNRTAPESVKELVFDPQMPSMGHGTSVADQVLTPEVGKNYIVNVEGIYFIMGGPWEIIVTADVDGVKDTVTFPVQVP
jgi:hypothetical protein